MLKTIEIGAAVRIAFFDPLSPQIMETFTLVWHLEHGGRLNAGAHRVGRETLLSVDRIAVGSDEVARALAQRVAGVANQRIELGVGGRPTLEATGRASSIGPLFVL